MKKHHITIIFILPVLFSVVCLAGCSDKPEGLLNKKKFTNILAEFIYIENLAVTNEQKQSLIKRTLENYNTTVREFNYTKDYYKENAKFWLKAYKQAQEKIKSRKTDLQQLVNQKSPADQMLPAKKKKNQRRIGMH